MAEGRPKVGLALSSGAIRGFSHMGVLQVFEEEGIPVDIIAGTSAGALVGGLYAMGHEIKYLQQLALNIRWEHVTDITIPRRGFVAGKKLLAFLRLITKGKKIEDLSIPFAAVATDIQNGERVVFKKGPLAEAIRASTSIPGIYIPYQKDGRMLVDGAVVDRIPISIVRELGAEIVIGVDVGFSIGHAKLNSIFEVLLQTSDIMAREISRERWIDADLLIRPSVSHLSAMDLNNTEQIIQAGVEATRNLIPELKKLTGVG